MKRRNFLHWSLGLGLASDGLLRAGAALGASATTTPRPDGRPHQLSLREQQFYLDGRRWQIRSGEMHPIRIPASHWLHRIRLAKAMGLNTIAIYLMWNALEPEPGQFDTHSGNRDFVRFIQLCQQEQMWVYLRPGPYICGEWDFGGLPPYLLADPELKPRTLDDPGYRGAVLRYLDHIAPLIRPLMAVHGGPVLLLQIENEYASFGHDLGYLAWLQQQWLQRGINGPFTISDGLTQIQHQHSYLPGTALGLDGDTDFKAGQALAGDAPVWVGEGYPGWLTHWGEPRMQAADYSATLQQILQAGRSFNLYVVHGGTNFGFGAGANADADGSHFQPVVTSYDYGAPITERGEPTAQYHHLRQLITAHTGVTPPALPATPPAFEFAPMTAAPWASLWDHLGNPHPVATPQANELLLGQWHGLVLYRKTLPADASGPLQVDQVHDYATVHYQQRYLGYVSRVKTPALLPEPGFALDAGGGELDILIDSFGHVGYGADMHDRKGLLGSPQLAGQALDDWQVYGLPLGPDHLRRLQPAASPPQRPGIFFQLNLPVQQVADTYLDMSEWDHGYVWVNGQLLGRYWRIGPQQRLYCPADYLQPGLNRILVLDLHRTVAAGISGHLRLSG